MRDAANDRALRDQLILEWVSTFRSQNVQRARLPVGLGQQPSGVPIVGGRGDNRGDRAMRTDQDFLLYPLGTEEQPLCPACGEPMMIALHEARSDRPDFSTFRCQDCTRSERFVFEN